MLINCYYLVVFFALFAGAFAVFFGLQQAMMSLRWKLTAPGIVAETSGERRINESGVALDFRCSAAYRTIGDEMRSRAEGPLLPKEGRSRARSRNTLTQAVSK